MSADSKSVIAAIPKPMFLLLNVKGRDLLETLGLPALREVVGGVLIGKNVRQATEMLTRRRLSLISGHILEMFKNFKSQGILETELYDLVLKEYFDKKASKDAKIVLRWILGLTTKQIQNVMRSREQEVHSYANDLIKNHFSLIGADYEDWKMHNVRLSDREKEDLSNLMLFTTIGAQSLAIRGSEKSLYGKFFEKMILGSVLSVLGFTFSEKPTTKSGHFWLSSTDKRESDATVLWKSGKAVRLDIGFIGVGNSEITLDKVSRFSKSIEISGKQFNVTTVVIVDRVGPGSSVFKQAKDIDGHIIQMSESSWVQKLGDVFEESFEDFSSPASRLSEARFKKFVTLGVQNAPLESIFKVAVSDVGDSDVQEGMEED